MHKVEDLILYKKAIQLAKDSYLLSSQLPMNEKFGLIPQIKRSAISIPSNIAEGAGRNSTNEFKHFLSIANGSTYELKTQLVLSIELKLLEQHQVQPVIQLCNEIQKINYSLQQKLTT